MPWVTPGTPPGKTSLRSPVSFFFVSQIWKFSRVSQPASTPPKPTRRSASTVPRTNRIVPSSALGALARDRGEHVDALAHGGGRFGIIANELRPLAHRRHVARLPGREGQHLARAVTERRARPRDRLEPAGELGERRRIGEQH